MSFNIHPVFGIFSKIRIVQNKYGRQKDGNTQDNFFTAKVYKNEINTNYGI
ncbi:hypothetical protein FACS189498_1460 [Spirochaetia bacterium]|nr:hypothetical protein FACS189498_1460 [Spirochaetia bacterium]